MVLQPKLRESRSPPGRQAGSAHTHTTTTDAGWSSPVARQAHNLKAAGSNPAPAPSSAEQPNHALTPQRRRISPDRRSARRRNHPSQPEGADGRWRRRVLGMPTSGVRGNHSRHMSDQAERTERPEQHLASMASLESRFQAQGEHRHGSLRGLSRSGFHEVAYTEWGDPASSRVVICLHGLSRQGRDFDPLASVLAADGYRVLCPDLVGRGRSGWLRDPEEYALPQYCMDMAVLIARTRRGAGGLDRHLARRSGRDGARRPTGLAHPAADRQRYRTLPALGRPSGASATPSVRRRATSPT